MPGRLGPDRQLPHPVLDERAIRQTGEAVVEGQMRELPPQRDPVADVTGGDQEPGG